MACINPDGTLSGTAKALLGVIEKPRTAEEISKELGLPLFRIRSSLRELMGEDLVQEKGNQYLSTPKGKEKI